MGGRGRGGVGAHCERGGVTVGVIGGPARSRGWGAEGGPREGEGEGGMSFHCGQGGGVFSL
jgi:hypothetical protein